MPEISMPRLSDSMQEGTIASWLVPDGAPVTEGDEILEIETDKTTVVFEAEYSGTLHHGLAEGHAAPVGAPIGTIASEATEKSDEQPFHAVERQSASPTATRLANRLGVEIGTVAGSGPSGRVLRRDVVDAHNASAASQRSSIHRPPDASIETRPSDADEDNRPGKRVPLNRIQKLIAGRMATTKAEVPDFTVSRDIDMSAVQAWREEMKRAGDKPVSYNEIILTCTARALNKHPLLNARFDEGHVVYNPQVDLSFAVATSDGNLLAPVIRGADRMTLREICDAASGLRDRAHLKELVADDLYGGTFTVSNLGMFDVSHFTAIINSNQSAILAVGRVREAVLVEDSTLRSGWRCQVALTCDHRIIYGAHAAAFLQDLDSALQHPRLLN